METLLETLAKSAASRGSLEGSGVQEIVEVKQQTSQLLGQTMLRGEEARAAQVANLTGRLMGDNRPISQRNLFIGVTGRL